MQIAAKNWQLPKASCRLRQRIGNCQKLPANCGKELATAKSFLQIAAKNWQLPKASCRLRQRIGNCQKLHANCSNELAVFDATTGFRYLISDILYYGDLPVFVFRGKHAGTASRLTPLPIGRTGGSLSRDKRGGGTLRF